jgi:hypothetical protein
MREYCTRSGKPSVLSRLPYMPPFAGFRSIEITSIISHPPSILYPVEIHEATSSCMTSRRHPGDYTVTLSLVVFAFLADPVSPVCANKKCATERNVPDQHVLGLCTATLPI